MENKDHEILYNLVWAALHGPHSKIAEKTDLACVYKNEYYSFAAISENTEKAYKELASIVDPGRSVILISLTEISQTLNLPEWNHIASPKGHIMIHDAPFETPDLPIIKLSNQDAPEMIALSKLSHFTGDLSMEIIEIGNFYGIKEDGHVVAMAGERLQLDDYTEVSGVSTHPDYRKRGYGGGMTLFKCKQVQERGKTPFLGVVAQNTGAVRLYKKMGFKILDTGFLNYLQRTNIYHLEPNP